MERNSGCVYVDPQRQAPCMAPIANRQLRMCQKHASIGRGMGVRGSKPRAPPGALSKGVKISQSPLEKWDDPPSIWRTEMCTTFKTGHPCRYGHTCAYAHTKKQLRAPGDPFPPIVYKPRLGEGEEPPALPDELRDASSIAPPPAKSPSPAADIAEGVHKHTLHGVPAADINPELCMICCEDGVFADRRWIPCGHMMCANCMTQWRQETIAKNVNGTTCPTCRSVVTGSEVLPKAEKANGPKQMRKVKNVWGNPEVTAANKQKFVGSLLTLEEEQAREALNRQRFREAQQRERELKEQEERARDKTNQTADQALGKTAQVGKATKPTNKREEHMHTNGVQRKIESPVILNASSRSDKRNEHAMEDLEARRLLEERNLQERERREREEAMEQARQQQQQQKQQMLQAQQQQHPTPQTQSTATSEAYHPRLLAYEEELRPYLIDIHNRLFNSTPWEKFSDFQLERIANMARGLYQKANPTLAPAVSPPPGFQQAVPATVSEQKIPVNVLLQAPGSVAVAGALPPPTADVSTSTKPQATLFPPKKVDESDSDEDISEAEKLKREEKRLQRLAQRKAKEEAIAKAAMKHKQEDGEFEMMSRYEYEQAKEAQRRLEQEREDLLLAKKLADEFAQMGTRPADPPIPKKRTDGKWNCQVCTFENEPLYPLCAMCMTPKDN